MNERSFSAVEIVESVYLELLGREPDAEGGEFFRRTILHDQGLMGVRHLLSELVHSNEFVDLHLSRLVLSKIGKQLRLGDQQVYSLGERCFSSWLLKYTGNKKRSGPFDWIFSSGEMVAEVLEDDFNRFLDPKHHVSTAPQLRATKHTNLSSHLYYEERFNIPFIYNHHDVTQAKGLMYFQRATQRLRDDLRSGSPLKFLLIAERPNLTSDTRARISAALAQQSSLTQTLFVSIDAHGDKSQTFTETDEGEHFSSVLYQAVSPLGALSFSDIIDDAVFARGVLQRLGAIPCS